MGMPTRNVNLSEYYDRFVAKSVQSGRYQNASEVVRAGLRLLAHEEHVEKAKLKALKRLTVDAFEALDRGEYRSYDGDELSELWARIDRDIAAGDT